MGLASPTVYKAHRGREAAPSIQQRQGRTNPGGADETWNRGKRRGSADAGNLSPLVQLPLEARPSPCRASWSGGGGSGGMDYPAPVGSDEARQAALHQKDGSISIERST